MSHNSIHSVSGRTRLDRLGLIYLLLIQGLSSSSAGAEEFQPLYRGARALAMGNAFTAVADDEQAIFYNPAGLANVTGYSFNLTNLNLEVSNELFQNYSSYSTTLSSPSLSALSTLVGKNLSARVQGTATVIGPSFGMAGIYQGQGALRLQDLVFPQGQIGALTTYGGQFAYSLPVKLRKMNVALNFGIAAKILYRSGTYFSPTLTQLMTMDTSAFTPNLNNPGIGYGVDLGTQYIYQARKNLTLQAGVVLKDLGDTSFSSGADPQKSELTAGIAARLRTRDLRATLAYDFSHILDNVDWRKKNHLGLELKFPFISLYGGMSQLYPSYGAGVDFWLIKLMYVSYAEELGSTYGGNPERRTVFQFAFKLEL